MKISRRKVGMAHIGQEWTLARVAKSGAALTSAIDPSGHPGMVELSQPFGFSSSQAANSSAETVHA